MKLIIAGSRTFADYQRLCQVLAPDRHRITQVITGGARGADQLGYRWAWKHAVRHQLFRANWEQFGKTAGVRRNHQMAQAGDLLLALGQRTLDVVRGELEKFMAGASWPGMAAPERARSLAIAGFLAIAFLSYWVRRSGFLPFVLYRIALGAYLLYVFYVAGGPAC